MIPRKIRAASLTPAVAHFLLPLLLFSFSTLQAEDVPAPTQQEGNHAAVSTSDGSIRDDELVDFICEQINKNGGKVKDVKLFVNACYGGGLLDDMERAFGAGGACAGIPWVAGTASDVEQLANGYADSDVEKYPEDNMGSGWTDGLFGNNRFNVETKAGVVRNGSTTNNVLQDLKKGINNDRFGPAGQNLETPQVASGNGGDMIPWDTETELHEAIVFGGANDAERHTNNIENVTQALKNIWATGGYKILSFPNGGSNQQLFDAIEESAARLTDDTQLVLYIDDHGASYFDFDEAIGGIANVLFEDPEAWEFDLPDSWWEGMWGNYLMSPMGIAEPGLMLNITQCQDCSNWGFYLNGLSIPFPAGNPTGMVFVPVPFWQFLPGHNFLEIVPQAASSTQSAQGKQQTHLGSLIVSSMQLTTGPISELENSLLQPGQSAAFYDPTRNGEGLFVELLENGQALVYMFTYDVAGEKQAWMLGLGYQTGTGIIINDFLRPVGATFGPDFDPGDVVKTNFGSLAFLLPTCGTSAMPGSLFVYPTGAPGYPVFGSNQYVQLTSILSCDTATGSANSPWSGSWFDPAHDGEGIILEVLEDGSAVVQWFTYDDEGGQMWIQGTGTFDGQTLTVDNLFTTGGTVWGGLYDPGAIVVTSWGSLTMTFTGCGTATVDYQSTAGFGSGTLNMQRITKLMGIDCTE
ncbi:hypothetical protein ACFL00_03610 [Pseudomonadota bacterium]